MEQARLNVESNERSVSFPRSACSPKAAAETERPYLARPEAARLGGRREVLNVLHLSMGATRRVSMAERARCRTGSRRKFRAAQATEGRVRRQRLDQAS